ncbi:unnamed protein product [Larinioides sclopetarius]|uniref:ATP-dependent DNA helicase n=1 Tax=Larinioides sclopetarius TaxID=280406 RepID=A0AAV2B7A7_9ARAC
MGRVAAEGRLYRSMLRDMFHSQVCFASTKLLNFQVTQRSSLSVYHNIFPHRLKCKKLLEDERTMHHKAAFEALDFGLKDIRYNNKRMEGVTMMLAGNFQQTLPAISLGTKEDK